MKTLVKQAIADSFMRLCSKKPIKAISVKDIIDYCNISRQTFYNYYHDKYDLMNFIYLTSVENIIKKFENSSESLYKSIEGVLEMCLENKNYYMSIAEFSVQNSFPQYFFDHTKNYYTNRLITDYGMESLTKSIELAIGFNTAGTEKLFMDWIKNGMKESPKYMAREICSCMPQELKKFYLDEPK